MSNPYSTMSNGVDGGSVPGAYNGEIDGVNAPGFMDKVSDALYDSTDKGNPREKQDDSVGTFMQRVGNTPETYSAYEEDAPVQKLQPGKRFNGHWVRTDSGLRFVIDTQWEE